MRRNSRRYARVAALVALSAAASACGLDTAAPRPLTDDDAPTSADVARSAGAGIAEDVGILMLNELVLAASASARPAATSPAPVAPGRAWTGPAACGYDAGAGRFQCPALAQDGLTLTRSYALRDTAGAAQASADPVSTASADFRVSVWGTITRDDWAANVSRTQAIIVSGLAGAEVRRIWNGTGARSIAGAGYTSNGVTRRYELEESDTLANVVVALPRRDYSWPASGSAIRHVTGTMTHDGVAPVARAIDRTVVVTFNSTGIVPLDANGARFWLNLVTGRVVPRE